LETAANRRIGDGIVGSDGEVGAVLVQQQPDVQFLQPWVKLMGAG
jgi:hypothetical protein